MNIVALPSNSSTKTVFPASALKACLLGELVEAIKAEAAIKGVSLPSSPASIANTPFQIDSLVVVSILHVVEGVVGFELPEGVVRAGGYPSAEVAFDDLRKKIEGMWNKRNGSKS